MKSNEFISSEIHKDTEKFKKKLSNILKRLSDIKSIDISEVKQRFNELSQIVDEPLRLVVAGEYNTGKSSLIKALTGKEVEIGSQPTTSNVRVIEFEGVHLCDLPGTLSGNPEHDAIAEMALSEANLILFVVSNELFNDKSLPFYLHICNNMQKHKQVILIVNQIDRTSSWMVSRSQFFFRVQESLRDTLKEAFPLRLVNFVSARDYLDSLKEDDVEIAAELMKDSRLSELKEELKSFIEDSGTMARLLSPLQSYLQIISSLLQKINETDGDEKYLNEFVARKLNAYQMTRKQVTSLDKELAIIVQREVQKLVDPILRAIESKADPESINTNYQNANNQMENITERAVKELSDSMGRILEDLNTDLSTIDKSTLGQHVFEILEGTPTVEVGQTLEIATGISKDRKKLIDKALKGSGKFLASNSARFGKKAVDLAKTFGHKFKPYGKINLEGSVAKYVGNAGKILGVLAIGLETYFEYKDLQQKEEESKLRRKFKGDVRDQFDQYVSSLNAFIKENTIEFLSSIDLVIDELRDARQKIFREDEEIGKISGELIEIDKGIHNAINKKY